MSPLDSIIYMIWRGIAVGILISAPMGPVGILCIQRTLEKGRHAGFYTGVGAAISDIFYCLLTGFGLSFIEDFIERNQNVIQLIGSVVLVAFSIYLFRKDPSSPLRHPVPQNVSMKKNILGGFLFTFSNPLIIFLIIGLFARFNFTSPEIKGAYYAIGYLFIIIGALLWWYGITYAIEKVRTRFNMRAMKIMNITIGVIILIFACAGMVSSITGLTAADARGATPMQTRYLRPEATADTPWRIIAPDEDMRIDTEGSSEFRLDFKLRLAGGRPTLTSTAGEPFLIKMLCGGDTLLLSLRVTEYSPTPLSSQPAMTCDASFNGGISLSQGTPATEGMALPEGWNHFRLSTDAAHGLILLAGEVRLKPLLEIHPGKLPEGCMVEEIALVAPADRRAELRDIRLRLPEPRPKPCMELEDARERIRFSNDPAEGLWEILDWSMETKYARQGGDYLLATVRAPGGWYDIIYVAGAETMPSLWKEGMLKGRLYPTGTPNVYNLEWIDAEGRLMDRKLRAQLLPLQNTLTLLFPYLETTIRLYKRE
ncbi:MAG: LysE family translocator [Muribaculaceae bacterium]|nr:LysE family translocator [Muribaculaceae bacterium]